MTLEGFFGEGPLAIRFRPPRDRGRWEGGGRLRWGLYTDMIFISLELIKWCWYIIRLFLPHTDKIRLKLIINFLSNSSLSLEMGK